jgi:hypothetical protein
VKKKTEIIPLIGNKSSKDLSKLQKDFNTKIKKIQTLKDSIIKFKDRTTAFRRRIQEELVPLEMEQAEKRVEFVKVLEKAYLNPKGLSKQDKEDLIEIILGESIDLIQNFGKEELIELYDKYNYDDVSYNEELAQVNEAAGKEAQDFIKQMFGVEVDLPDDPDMDPFTKANLMKEQIEEKMRQKAWDDQQRSQKRKKTAKQIAKEKKVKEEAELLSKSTRTIYTDLAKQLHPDLESDAKKKDWKTEMMQRITEAYNNDDLYELLKLQIEFQNRENNLQGLPEDTLSFYVKILNDQVKMLQGELDTLTSFFINPELMKWNMLGFRGSESDIERGFSKEKQKIKAETKTLESTVKYLQDIKAVKNYLKEERRKEKAKHASFEDVFSFYGRNF